MRIRSHWDPQNWLKKTTPVQENYSTLQQCFRAWGLEISDQVDILPREQQVVQIIRQLHVVHVVGRLQQK